MSIPGSTCKAQVDRNSEGAENQKGDEKGKRPNAAFASIRRHIDPSLILISYSLGYLLKQRVMNVIFFRLSDGF